jgi:hypothetical protein
VNYFNDLMTKDYIFSYLSINPDLDPYHSCVSSCEVINGPKVEPHVSYPDPVRSTSHFSPLIGVCQISGLIPESLRDEVLGNVSSHNQESQT